MAKALSLKLDDPTYRDTEKIRKRLPDSRVLPVSVHSSIFPGRAVAAEATETERRVRGVRAG